MRAFDYRLPQQTYFAKGCLAKIPELIRRCGAQRPLIISDRVLKNLGVVDHMAGLVHAEGKEAAEFLDIEANPSVETVEKAAAVFADSDSDCLIALGGGSPMDVAKAVGILHCYGGKIVDYEGYEKVPGPISPIIAIPTTAGTGSEATGTTVINDRARRFKFGVCSEHIVPRFALLDSELIMTLPASVAANTGIDAFIHCFEAYISNESQLFSDCFCEKGFELTGKFLRRFVANRRDEEAAFAMMVVSNYGGIACAKARLGTVHAMAHPVSAFFGVAHGVANAVLLPAVAGFNALADKGKYEKIYYLLTGNSIPRFRPEMLTEELVRLMEDIGLPRHLAEVGVDAGSIPAMAEDAMKSGNVLRNPRHTTLNDVQRLFQQSM